MSENSQKKALADGLVIIPTTSNNFLRSWLELMKPFHHLAPREMDFAAILLAKRYEISKSVSNQNMIDKLLFEEEMRNSIMEEAGVTKAHMQVILRKLRESGLLEGKKVARAYIPAWTEGKPFRMVFVFENKDDTQRNDTTSGE